MSPEDELLSRIVLYVGMGIGLLCMAAAIVIQIWMFRRGKATRKDTRELLTGLILMAMFAVPGIIGMLAPGYGYKPSTSVSAAVNSFFVAWITSILISRLPEFIETGAEAVRGVAGGSGLRAVFSIIYVAAFITAATFAIGHFMPEGWLLRATALFVGCVGGLIWRAVRLAQASRPEEPPEAESLIIKASS